MGSFVVQLPENHPLVDKWTRLNPFYSQKHRLRWECSCIRFGQELFEIVTVTRNQCICKLSSDIIPKGEKALRIKFYSGGKKTAYFSLKALKQYGAWDKMRKNMRRLEKLMGDIEVDEVYSVESHKSKLDRLMSEIRQLEEEIRKE